MGFVMRLAVLSCFAGPLVSAVLTVPSKSKGSLFIPNKFIIEAENISDLSGQKLSAVHERLYHDLQSRSIDFTVDKEYDSAVFVGAAITLSNPDDIQALKTSSGIKAAYPIRVYERPSLARYDVVTVDSPEVDTQSSHVMTGVDKLHAEGIFGEGIRIGVIDTGIDYTHPALGGGFGPGFKVEGGYDLVGDDYNGYNDPVPDDDPLDQCEGHGTHVSGIIAADPGNLFNISGVAYASTLTEYRVFGCVGSVTDDVIIDALILGYNEGLDILSLSLGGADGWTEGISSVVASNIAATGVIVTISAGNSGDSGSWYTSSPGNGLNVISVASVDNIAIAIQNATVGGVEHDPITYYELFPWEYTDPLPIYATSNDTTVVDDACAALPDDTPDLSPYLVIVRRGTCAFTEKLTNIAAKGAQIAFIYDNGNGFAGIEVGDFNASLIQAADGEFLVEQFAAGNTVTISFPQSGGSYEFPDPNGGLVSTFTSYGPTNDLYFKPAVGAPGGNILSTVPTTQGSYAILSGTSMAAPFVAGVSALLLSVKGTTADVATSAKTLFETTAKKVPVDNTGAEVYQTVTQQGAGLIDAYAAIHASTVVSPGELLLNDTEYFNGVQSFTVSNTGGSSKDYTISHVAAATALTVDEDGIYAALGPVPLSNDVAQISFSANSFTLASGESTTITATITPPTADEELYPVYSGFIEISTGSEVTHVSYLGLAASLKEKQVLDRTDLPEVLNSVGQVQNEPTNYTFVENDWPSVIFSLVFGSPDVQINLVSSNSTLEAIETVGVLEEYKYLSRNDAYEAPYYRFSLMEPIFADGSNISNGSYKILVSALKPTGNKGSDDDKETWLSPIVGVTV